MEAELAGESNGELATVEGAESAVMFLRRLGCWERAVVVAMIARRRMQWQGEGEGGGESEGARERRQAKLVAQPRLRIVEMQATGGGLPTKRERRASKTEDSEGVR